MQKNKLWILLIIAVVATGALIYWLAPSSSTGTEQNSHPSEQNLLQQTEEQAASSAQTDPFSSKSQQDTEVNCQMQLDAGNRLIVNEQTRDCFEYFITQMGEKNMDQIQQSFKAYIEKSYKEPALGQIIDLWNRYLQYRQQLGTLKSPGGSQEEPGYYAAIFNDMKNLRKQFFSAYEIEGLFGTEDIYNDYTIERMKVLADKKLSESEKAKKLKALFDDLPEDWKENLEQLNKLEDLRKLTADIKARGGSAEELHQMRTSLVGAEATARLETLDVQRGQWKNNINSYLSERDSILNSGMSDSAKQQAIDQLRTQHFSSKQDQLRAETFESVHDQGQKLPFAD